MSTFGQLLRQYRRQCADPLRGGMLTQARLGELLGDELGHAGYSGAAVSDWERDKSKIHADDRPVLVALTAVLHHCGGLETVDAANSFLTAGNYRALDDSELADLFPTTVTSPVAPSVNHSVSWPQRPAKLQILLEKVEQFWIKGVLEKSVREALLLDIQRDRLDTAVNHPWQDILNTAVTEQSQQTIADSFFETDRALLLLGAPGAGKTTTLITLAQALAALAQADAAQPIPVILNLASWAEKRPLLSNWIIDELTTKYQIPRQDGRHWVEANQLILLLDGLDEVARVHQAECVQAINAFRIEHGLAGLVVCSRLEDYEGFDEQLNLNGALLLRPLTPTQIQAYLTAVGIPWQQMSETVLYEMAQSPLMLRVLSELAQTETAIMAAEDNEAHSKLFDVYVNQMLARRGSLTFSAVQTKSWLGWLARKMNQHNQVLFLLEQMQPSWLPSRRLQRLFLLSSRLVDGFSLGCLIWMFWFLVRLTLTEIKSIWALPLIDKNPDLLPPFSLLLFILMFLILGLLAGAVDIFFYERRADLKDAYRPRRRDEAVQTVVVVLVVTLVSFTAVGLFRSPLIALASSLFTGVSFALTTYFIHGYSYRSDIRTVELLSWSWRGATAGLMIGLVTAAIFEFIEYQVVGPTPIFRTVFSITLLSVLLGGLRGNRLPTTHTPNQGIRLSGRSALAAASLFAIIMSLATTIFWGSTFGVLAGLVAAWIAGALYGAGSVINHFLLRLWLFRLGRLPRHYPAFLDEAANRVILNKVGGGYMFIHRLLQEHFATSVVNEE